MGKRADLEPRAIGRYAEGLEIPQLAIELEVSENSLRAWKTRAGTEWDEARADFRRGQLASMEDIGRRMQRVRTITDRIDVDPKNQGRLGQILNEGLQTMLFDVMDQMQTNGIVDADAMAESIGHMKSLALILQRTEQAANLNLKREQEIRLKALSDAAAVVSASATGKKGGLSDEAANEIRMKILGIGA
jgi:hypothetical protein